MRVYARQAKNPQLEADADSGVLVMKRNPNPWERSYGAARRAIDRALLEEAERQLDRPYSIEDDIREAVAREFGLNHAAGENMEART
jgi:hypothetical protein